MTRTESHKKPANRWNNDYLFNKQAEEIDEEIKKLIKNPQELYGEDFIGPRETRLDMGSESIDSAFDNPQDTINAFRKQE